VRPGPSRSTVPFTTSDYEALVLDDVVRGGKHVPAVVRDMITFQYLTGCRPQEVCSIKPVEADRSGKAWLHRPGQHKTKHKGKTRTVVIGPRAQKVPEPYLFTSTAVDAPCFSPA
jgi:integrase